MTDKAGRPRHPHPSPKSVRFAELSAEVLAALLDRDLAAASAAAGVPLTGYFISPEALKLWRLRAVQIAADPQSARWIARAAVAEPEGSWSVTRASTDRRTRPGWSRSPTR